MFKIKEGVSWTWSSHMNLWFEKKNDIFPIYSTLVETNNSCIIFKPEWYREDNNKATYQNKEMYYISPTLMFIQIELWLLAMCVNIGLRLNCLINYCNGHTRNACLILGVNVQYVWPVTVDEMLCKDEETEEKFASNFRGKAIIFQWSEANYMFSWGEKWEFSGRIWYCILIYV